MNPSTATGRWLTSNIDPTGGPRPVVSWSHDDSFLNRRPSQPCSRWALRLSRVGHQPVADSCWHPLFLRWTRRHGTSHRRIARGLRTAKDSYPLVFRQCALSGDHPAGLQPGHRLPTPVLTKGVAKPDSQQVAPQTFSLAWRADSSSESSRTASTRVIDPPRVGRRHSHQDFQGQPASTLKFHIFTPDSGTYGSPLIDSVPPSQFPRGGSYTAIIQGSGLQDATSFVASDPNIAGFVTSASDPVVTVQLSSTSVPDGDKQNAPILGVAFALIDSMGNYIPSPVTFDIVTGPPPQVTSWKITNSVVWVPGGVATTVTYQSTILDSGNIQFFYLGGPTGGNITSWTVSGTQFQSTSDLTIQVTVPINFSFTNWGTIYGAVDGAGQGGTTDNDPLDPSQVLNLPVVQMQFVDPVPGTGCPGQCLLNGSGITTDTMLLSTEGTVVAGVAADGAAQLVLRIAGAPPNEVLSLNLAQDGGLANIGSNAFQSGISVQADATGHAFFLYRAPDDFAQTGTTANSSATQRIVDVNFQSSDNQGVIGDTQITVVRPPVFLIHGLWGKPGDWDMFVNNLQTALGSQLPFQVYRAAYNFPLPPIASVQPPLTPSAFKNAMKTANVSSLGFTFIGGGFILPQLAQGIGDFKDHNNVAAVQADIIAHSMGGVVTRTLPRFGVAYYADDTFGAGLVHKLITIATPHLGSPLATDLLSSSNSCVRNQFSAIGQLVAASVTTNAPITMVNGGVGDLRGDGFGGSLSPALSAIQVGSGSIPTAFVVGNGCGFVDCPFSTAPGELVLHALCPSDQLVQHQDSFDWPRLFTQDSDAIVPVTSARNNGRNGSVAAYILPDIHSVGTHNLGFTATDVLGDSNTAAGVIQLLNTARSATPTYTPLF